jgi:WD40 repeat protein
MGGAGSRGIVSEVRLIDVKTQKVRRTLRPRAPATVPAGLGFDEAGRRLVVLSLLFPSLAGEVSVWDVETGELVSPPVHPGGTRPTTDLAPSGTRLAVTAGNRAQVWDLDTGRPVFGLACPRRIDLLRYTRGGQVLAAVCDTDVYLFDARTGEGLGPPLTHYQRVLEVAVSADGHWAATAGRDRQLNFWDLERKGGDDARRDRLVRLPGGQEAMGATTVPLSAERLAGDWAWLRRHPPPMSWTPRRTRSTSGTIAGARPWSASAPGGRRAGSGSKSGEGLATMPGGPT